MKYKVRIELLDESDVVLARTTMAEDLAKTISIFHGNDVLLGTLSLMKDQINVPRGETDSELLERIKDDILSQFIKGMENSIINRRGKTAEELMITPIEDDVMITKEDVTDYTVYFGCTEEVAYENLKKYFLRETEHIERYC